MGPRANLARPIQDFELEKIRISFLIKNLELGKIKISFLGQIFE